MSIDNFGELVDEIRRRQETYSKEVSIAWIVRTTADLIATCKQYAAVYGVPAYDNTLTERICSTLLSEYDYQKWGDEKIEDE